MAIFFAFCCLGCSAMNDFVFKLFARKIRSRGMFVFSVGVIWTFFALFLPGKSGVLSQTILWGVISGIFSVVGNILLIEAMARQSAGLCSTIYRLNLALVVPGAALLFKEHHPLYQYCGIVFALLAVLFFLPDGKGSSAENKKASVAGLLMVILAAVLRGMMGLAYKYGFNNGAAPNGVNLVNGICWISGGMVYYLLRERRQENGGDFSGKVFGYGALSGFLVYGIVFFMAQAVSLGDAGIVLPIAQMSFILTFLLSVIFLHERFTLYKALAMGSGGTALLLLSI